MQDNASPQRRLRVQSYAAGAKRWLPRTGPGYMRSRGRESERTEDPTALGGVDSVRREPRTSCSRSSAERSSGRHRSRRSAVATTVEPPPHCSTLRRCCLRRLPACRNRTRLVRVASAAMDLPAAMVQHNGNTVGCSRVVEADGYRRILLSNREVRLDSTSRPGGPTHLGSKHFRAKPPRPT